MALKVTKIQNQPLIVLYHIFTAQRVMRLHVSPFSPSQPKQKLSQKCGTIAFVVLACLVLVANAEGASESGSTGYPVSREATLSPDPEHLSCSRAESTHTDTAKPSLFWRGKLHILVFVGPYCPVNNTPDQLPGAF